jgi:hypothetical protein
MLHHGPLLFTHSPILILHEPLYFDVPFDGPIIFLYKPDVTLMNLIKSLNFTYFAYYLLIWYV